jgi:hypothetical protein
MQIARWEADPAELAELIAQWNHARPSSMTGVIWYRLPVATDLFNWRWPTLAAVMEGRAPRSQLEVKASVTQPTEIVVINNGECDEPFPGRIETCWSEGRFVAADALAGYELDREPGNVRRVAFVRTAETALSRLSPGAQRPIGWIRLENPTRITIAAHMLSRRADRNGASSFAEE